MAPEGTPRRIPEWEDAEPIEVKVTLDHQCYPIERRIPRYGNPIHQVAKALHRAGVSAYSIHQALSSVSSFWGKVSSGDRTIDDYENGRR